MNLEPWFCRWTEGEKYVCMTICRSRTRTRACRCRIPLPFLYGTTHHTRPRAGPEAGIALLSLAVGTSGNRVYIHIHIPIPIRFDVFLSPSPSSMPVRPYALSSSVSTVDSSSSSNPPRHRCCPCHPRPSLVDVPPSRHPHSFARSLVYVYSNSHCITRRYSAYSPSFLCRWYRLSICSPYCPHTVHIFCPSRIHHP